MGPLVSVICLCYNQAAYVEAALNSVKNQTYNNIELIIVDDSSTDTSVLKIKNWITSNYPNAQFLALPSNQGNCSAFNKALALAKGKYCIDLAADDILYPAKILRQVHFFELLDEITALIYSDANYVDERARNLWKAYTSNGAAGKINKQLAVSGSCFTQILERHFICPPTTMFRTDSLKKLGGYDETLAYEDWDIYVRLGRKFKIAFQDEVLMEIRVLPKSHGSKHNPQRAKYLLSTVKICKKAYLLCEAQEEKAALSKRTRYEMRNAAREGYWEAVKGFAAVLSKLKSHNLLTSTLLIFSKVKQ
jgi:glycosyltransferase involved in cell wall biosynthesis